MMSFLMIFERIHDIVPYVHDCAATKGSSSLYYIALSIAVSVGYLSKKALQPLAFVTSWTNHCKWP